MQIIMFLENRHGFKKKTNQSKMSNLIHGLKNMNELLSKVYTKHDQQLNYLSIIIMKKNI